jgi:superfamily II DNA or RNA helicase
MHNGITEIQLEPEFHEKLSKLLNVYLAETHWPKNIISKSHKLRLLKIRVLGDEIYCESIESGDLYKTKLTLPLFDSFTISRCSCLSERSFLDEKPCQHLFLAAKELSSFLDKSMRKTDIFGLIDSLQGTQHSEIIPSGKGLEWNITRDFIVEAYSGGKLSQASLKQKRFELAEDQDWKVIGLFIDKEDFKITKISEIEAFYSVKLKDMPYSGPLELKEASFELHVKQDGAYLQTVLRIDGEEVSQNYLMAPDGLAVHREQNLYFQKMTSPEADFFHSILKTRPRVHMDDKERLLRHLVNLEAKIPVSADKELAKSSGLAPDSLPRVRFSLLSESSWLLEVLVKPGGGSSFIPGLGPEVVIDVREPVPSLLARNLEYECHLARELVEKTPLKALSGAGVRFLTESQDVILECIQELETRKYPIEWPKNGVIPKITEDSAEAKISLQVADKNLWFEATGMVTINAQTIALKEVIRALRNERRYIELSSGAWVKISSELKARAEKLSDLLEDDDLTLSGSGALELLKLNQDFEIEKATQKFSKLQRQWTEPLDLTLPHSLSATLRPYQIIGYEWLQTLSHRGLGGCLADDMGLGKTLQTIAVLLKNKELGPSLVVAPVSLLHNWQSEIRRFSPDLTVKLWAGGDRKLDEFRAQQANIVLTSYGTMIRDIEMIKKQFWNITVIDEAQNIKNPNTLNWKMICQIPSRWKLALSGTPIENKLEELWAILSAVCPGVLGKRDEFKRRFELPIQKGNSERARALLKRRMAPFLLRRLKVDHLKELPGKTEKTLYAVPDENEKNFYEACRMDALERIQKQLAVPEKPENLRFEVLASLQTLRQVACHPALLNPEWCEASAKETLFVATVLKLLEAGHKVLVFSQFTRFLSLMQKALKRCDIDSFYLDGSTPLDKRKLLVDQFQNGDKDVFFISLKAGGTGLNLTAADFVIHLDPWWNPAVETQASDRAWRMGQKKPVTVYRIVTEGSIEEKILSLHEKKRFLSEDITAHATGNLEDLLSVLGMNEHGPKKDAIPHCRNSESFL